MFPALPPVPALERCLMRNQKLRQRFHDISTGILLAVGVLSVWGLVKGPESSIANFSGLWLLVCLVIAFGLMWGRKFLQKPAGEVLSEDKRPPVLYLRSFKDDDVTSGLIDGSASPVSYTEEEYLVDILKDFGPCIAIGQPGEKLPSLGAARMYLADDQWQDKVKELLTSSTLVALRAGKTKNFLWEVEQSIKSIDPRKLILLIPRKGNIYSEFHKLASRSFPRSLPENIGDPDLFLGIASLYGYIYFDDDWTPHFTRFEFRIPYWQRRMSFPVTYVIRDSLAPIYERFGIPIPKTENTSLGLVLAAFLLSMLALVLLNGYINEL